MKKLAVLISLLIASHLSIAESDNQKAMASMLFCYGAYNSLGYTYSANETMTSIIRLTDYMSEREVNQAKFDAVRMVDRVRSKGVTTKQIANICDGVND